MAEARVPDTSGWSSCFAVDTQTANGRSQDGSDTATAPSIAQLLQPVDRQCNSVGNGVHNRQVNLPNSQGG
jgi:hypothetical protein